MMKSTNGVVNFIRGGFYLVQLALSITIILQLCWVWQDGLSGYIDAKLLIREHIGHQLCGASLIFVVILSLYSLQSKIQLIGPLCLLTVWLVITVLLPRF